MKIHLRPRFLPRSTSARISRSIRSPRRSTRKPGRRFRTGQNRAYLTFAGQLGWKGRNLAVTWTKRNTNNMTALNDTDTHFQVSAGHAFDFGLTTDVGWKVSEDAGVKTRTPGALAKYAIEF